MNYLITASSGFVGSRFQTLSKKYNSNFKFLTRKCSNFDKNFFYCDINREIRPKIFDNIDIVIHIAGYAHEGNNKVSDELCYKTNYTATMSLAKLALKQDVKKFIYLSTVKAAGEVHGHDIDEKIQGEIKSMYSHSKRKAEIELFKLFSNEKTKVIIMRSALMYGPNLKGNLSKMYNAINKNIMPRPPVSKSRKSMVHLDDVIESLIFAANNSKCDNQIFNITDNQVYDLEKIYNIFSKKINKGNKLVVPKFFYFLLGLLGSYLNKIIFFPFTLKSYNSMFEDSHFSSKKINKIGFYTKKTLEDFLNDKEIK